MINQRLLSALCAGLLGCTTATAMAAGAVSSESGAATRTSNGADSTLQPVARFGSDFKMVGVGVSQDGRVFASAPTAQADDSPYSLVEVEPDTGALSPYPDADWNHYQPEASGAKQWVSVQALWVDRANHLWALDKGLGKPKQPPKLVEMDLAKNKVIHNYTFGRTLAAQDSLNDVRVDLKHGYAYLSNAKNGGGVVVLNLKSGTSRLVLQGDKSSVADPDQHLMFGDEIAKGKDGKELVLDTDGVALSPDRKYLYYRPLSDRHYYRIPTAALIDHSLTPDERAAEVQYLGDSVVSGGIAMSDAGVLYVGNLEDHSVVALTPTEQGGKPGLRSQLAVKDPAQLAWADGFAIANGYLYIADSHLNETAFSNGYPRSGPFTIFRMPLLSAAAGAPDPN